MKEQIKNQIENLKIKERIKNLKIKERIKNLKVKERIKDLKIQEKIRTFNIKNAIENLKNHYLFSQPHQPFFLLAFINALLSMLMFALYFEGTISAIVSAKFYHAYSLIFLLFTPAFFAFLFTTFPRFSGTDIIERKKYLEIFWLIFAGSLFTLIGSFSSFAVMGMGMMLTLVAHIMALIILSQIQKNATSTDTEDQWWILLSVQIGLISHFIFILSLWFPSLYFLAVQMAIYLYLFGLIFTIAQRMVPFFSHAPIEKHRERLKVIIGLLVLHVLLEMIQPHSSFLADFVLTYLFAREIWRWKLPFPNENSLVWILHIGLFWIPIAFFISSVSSLVTLINGTNFLYLGMHTLVVGFFFTMLIGFGTRVTLGHSGNMMRADIYTRFLFYWTQIVVLSRILTSLSLPNNWDIALFYELSVTLWILMFLGWAYRFFAVLIVGKKFD